MTWGNTVSELGFADRNKNGLLDLAVQSSSGGNCCLPLLMLFEILDDGTVRNITAESSDAYPIYFTDLEPDGVLELFGWSEEFYSQQLRRWWGWDGTAYVDISAQHPEFYLPEIEKSLKVIASNDGCYVPDEFLARVLQNYYALGRLKSAWPELRQELGWDSCSVEMLAAHGERMLYFESWVREHS